MLELKVKLFGAFRKYGDGQEVVLKVLPGARVADLRVKLSEALKKVHSNFTEEGLIREAAFALETRILSDAEEICQSGTLAVLPPVCGG